MSSVLVRPIIVAKECVKWTVERNIAATQKHISDSAEIDMSFFDVEFDDTEPEMYPPEDLGVQPTGTRVDAHRLDVFLSHVTALHGIELPPWNTGWDIYGDDAVAWLTAFWEQRNARLHFQGNNEFLG